MRYKYSVHAERNVIYLAAKLGIKTDKLIMVSPWATCSDCAQAIIQTGISEANIEIIIFNGKVGSGKILRQGKFWEP